MGSVIDAIESVVDTIIEPFAVTQTGAIFTTTEPIRIWSGAWVELIGANEDVRYQVSEVSTYQGITTIELAADKLDDGVIDIALILDYQFGHYKEIQQTLLEQMKDTKWKSRLYPKLLLFLDIKEAWGAMVNASLDLAIVTSTRSEWKAADRKVKSFDSVLHPLFELFIYELELAPGISVEPSPPFDKWDRYFWGSQPTPDQNVFAALLDAIEINNLEVVIDRELCNNIKR